MSFYIPLDEGAEVRADATRRTEPMGDLNEAVRLDPKNTVCLVNRVGLPSLSSA